MDRSPVELEALVRERAPQISKAIRRAAHEARNEADLVAPVEDMLQELGRFFDITLRPQRERTLINGRADAVYNRFVIEYEPPESLRASPTYGHNRHAVGQVKQYMDELERLDRHKKERLAGVVLDGSYYIFVRYRDDHWRVDDPVAVTPESTETFLRYLLSLSTELALTPENLARDFGENSNVARLVVSTLYDELGCTDCAKVKMLFKQWQVQFSEITGWAKQASDSKLVTIVRSFGVTERDPDLLRFFFAVHTYYATFIKLLAVQIAQYYMMPRLGSGLQQVASADSPGLQSYLARMERGGIFKELGINNFLEGDFFGWYLDIWDERIDHAIRRIVSDLANYSLVTLDVDPEQTRDLLKKLYQDLMPRKLRHALGEYYTPDWLAERLLNQLGYEGDPTKRLLDPACGSGTFLVLAIRRVREYVKEKMLPERAALEQVLSNIVGFDLNPLAVISARTNYLLALGDLLKHRMTEISIPVYLADSVLTPSRGTELFTQNAFSFNTVVGRFSVPRTLVEAQYINQLADLLEESVNNSLDRDQFRQRLLATFPLDAHKDAGEIGVALDLFDQLRQLHANGINGIWARIIKNAFAPLFVGQFDFVAGNPPWVNWESLPEEYRQQTVPLWHSYGMVPAGGLGSILGKSKMDISMLMTYAAADSYLKPAGKLGFIITQSVFKTAGAGQGFRRFRIDDKTPLGVIHVDDMSRIKPFAGAANRTAVVILQKGRPTRYPVPYTLWRKTTSGRGLSDDDTLDEMHAKTSRSDFVAEPVDENDVTSSWLSGKRRALKASRNVIGSSHYQAYAGSYTGGANGVYWLEIISHRPDGMIVVCNLTEGAKREVENVQAAIEPDLVYPLLRGRDVSRWQATPQAHILMVQDPQLRRGYDENWLRVTYPKTYGYLKHFESVLRQRQSQSIRRLMEAGPFYSMFAVSDYTFAPYKVVWPEVSNDLRASVTESAMVTESESKVVVPDHTLILIPCESSEEAHYICAALNSSPAQFTVRNYIVMHPDTHVMKRVHIPRYDPQNATHCQLAVFSQQAHSAVAAGQPVAEIEAEIDRLAAQLWGLTDEELIEIQQSLAELE